MCKTFSVFLRTKMRKNCFDNEQFFCIEKGWLAIAKLKPLSLFIPLILMLKKHLT